RTPIQALIDELKEGNFTYEYECDNMGEERIDYQWALTHVARLFDGISRPSVIVTDRELALMNAFEIIFSDSANLLCLWHINKNILKNCKPQFLKKTENEESDEWQLFLAKWNDI
ncbi:15070_t:CDS:2, partial [Funneliformis caledonium]